VIRPTASIQAIPSTTPFVGPEQLMRESGRSELVRLGANESAFGPSPAAVAAMAAELERLAWYGDPESFALREALAAKHACRIEQICVASGIDDVMGLAVRAFVAPGARTVATAGTYPTFHYHVLGYGGILETVSYRDDGRLDLCALLVQVARSHPAILYIANPDNPSGTFIPRAEMVRFVEALPDDVLIFLDEAYADFVDEGELLPSIFEDRIVRTRTFSKAYGMAGARIGYALSSAANIATFQKIRLHYGVNRNAQIGALASLRDPAFTNWVVEQTAAGRDDYYALARELGTPVIESFTNFVCMDMRDATRAVQVMNALLERGVWIRKPGLAPLDRFIRVSVGTRPMREAFARALRDVLTEVAA
jgi:histidinol-phosphate aminotransferase